MLQKDIITNLVDQYDQLKSAKNTKALAKWCPEELVKATNFLPIMTKIYIRIWHIRNQIWSIPGCRVCGKPTRFDRDNMNYRTYCCKKCSANDPQTKDKKSQSILQKYGTSVYFQSDDYKKKSQTTCLEKYGVDHPNKSKVVRQKTEATNLSKYGYKTNLQSEETKQKIRDTLVERYGVDNPSKCEKIVEKIKTKTASAYKENLDKILEKRRQTNLERYGKWDPAQSHMTQENVELSYNSEWLAEQNQQFPICYIAKKLGMSTAPLAERFRVLGINPKHHNTSSAHRIVVDFIRMIYRGEIIENDRKILNGMELDIVIPEFKLAIEIDGVYWHGEVVGNKSKNYHSNKTQQCKSKGITLVHIWDLEVEKNLDIVLSRLANLFGISTKVGARQLQIKPITGSQASVFHIENHLASNATASFHLALTDSNGNIMMCMSIANSRFGNKSALEIVRMTTAKGYIVIGGISKLLKELRKLYPGKTLITYADLKWGQGNGYKMAGFIHVKNTGPCYWYRKGNKLYHRSHFQKHKLNKLLETFNPNLSEWENMKNNGWDRIWDCGHALWQIDL